MTKQVLFSWHFCPTRIGGVDRMPLTPFGLHQAQAVGFPLSADSVEEVRI
jgi:hypothetical protein